MTLAQETKQALAELGKTPTHALGQNFLIDDTVRKRIFELADVRPEDTVEEIGPGLGILTGELVKRAHAVIAIEADLRLAEYIRKTYPSVSVIQADALQVDHASFETLAPNKLVANLPYNIAATVLLDAFVSNRHLESATVMVQKEVADRMGALVGTKTYGAYSAKLGLYAKKVASFDVSPHSFFPAPHVVSSVIKLKRHQALTDEPKEVAALITKAFAQRRKTLLNNLKAAGYGADSVTRALEELGFLPDIRAERLSSKDFVELRKVLS